MDDLTDKMVHIKVPLSFARNLKWYNPPCPSSDEAWEYTYLCGTTVICLAVNPPYAENSPFMISVSKRPGSLTFTGIKVNVASVICIASPGQGFLHLGEKMEKMAGVWKRLGKVDEVLELIKTK